MVVEIDGKEYWIVGDKVIPGKTTRLCGNDPFIDFAINEVMSGKELIEGVVFNNTPEAIECLENNGYRMFDHPDKGNDFICTTTVLEGYCVISKEKIGDWEPNRANCIGYPLEIFTTIIDATKQ